MRVFPYCAIFHQECLSLTGKQSAMEGDAWVISFLEAENRLLIGGCRRKCLSILKTLRDQGRRATS